MKSRDEALELLSELFSKIQSKDDWQKFNEDFFSPSELLQMAERWLIVEELAKGATQRAVADKLGVSISKVTRGAQVLKFGKGGFKALLK